jgi:hypothetical protein
MTIAERATRRMALARTAARMPSQRRTEGSGIEACIEVGDGSIPAGSKPIGSALAVVLP